MTSRREAPESPKLLGRYVLGELLGEGSYARVYAASDALSGARVALKLFPPGASLAELRVERAALRGLRLPAAPALLDEGEDSGRPVLVMERVDGRRLFEPGRVQPWAELAPHAVAFLEVLGSFHAAGALHLDLKPAHVVLRAGASIALLDFGLSGGWALRRDPRPLRGFTPRYAAPEQILDDPLDNRADLYTAGLLLYEALSGRLPHRGEGDALVARRVREAPEPLLADAAPPEVIALLNRLLSPFPEDRPASAGEALAALGPLPRPWLDARVPAAGPPLSAGDCEGLFGGPRLWLRLPQRAGAELWRRTAGEREAVRAELAAWHSLGLIGIEAEKLKMEADALARLAQPAYERLVGRPGEGPPPEAPGAALALARARLQAGALSEAEDALGRSLALARAGSDAALEEDTLWAWLRLALAEGTPGALDRALFQVHTATAVPAALSTLTEAAGLASRQQGSRALALLRAPPVLPHAEARECFLMVLFHAAVNAGPEAQAAALARARALAEEHPEPELQLRLRLGEARFLYTKGQYREAAQRYEGAQCALASTRLAAMNHAAVCWLEVPDHARSARLAEEAERLAAELPLYACRAAQTRRAALWRSGAALPPDPALPEAAEALRLPLYVGLHGLTEAAFAWRAGDPLALSLAERAQRAFAEVHSRGGEVLARALLAALREDAALARPLIEDLAAHPLPDIDWQALGLLSPWLNARERSLAVLLTRRAPHPGHRRELLSPAESLQLLITDNHLPAT